MTLEADRTAARLLLSDPDCLDFVLWEDALEAYDIDEAGTIHLSGKDVQKRLRTTLEYSSTHPTSNGAGFVPED